MDWTVSSIRALLEKGANPVMISDTVKQEVYSTFNIDINNNIDQLLTQLKDRHSNNLKDQDKFSRLKDSGKTVLSNSESTAAAASSSAVDSIIR